MKHYWFSDEDGNDILNDYRGNLEGAIKYAERSGIRGCIYINDGEDIVDVVFN